MSSCKRATEARIRAKLKDSTATMNNHINSHSGKMCNCGKMCKNHRGLKIHQEKIECQAPVNKLAATPQRCFVSLQNVILSSCLTFDDGVYCGTSENTFIPVSNSEKPVARNKCYVQPKTKLSIVWLNIYVMTSTNVVRHHVTHATCSLIINFFKVIWLVKAQDY